MESLKTCRCFALAAFSAATVAAIAGCGEELAPGDEAAARKTLAAALDAWVAGVSAAQLRQQSPAIIVVDQDWTEGCRLVDYELTGAGLFDGRNLRASVALTLQRPPTGPAKRIAASYVVGMQPIITVVRVME